MQPDLIGGRYRVASAIGQGGMGTVWLCRDETLRRDVAVKQVGLLPHESVTDSARAFREARSSATLSHRNVVTVFDVVEEEGSIWLVMEHVPSRSLSDLIKQDGRLDPADVADLGAQLADGLAAAHAAGTIHRDVKPGNVLVREDGVAKISDFGIARSAGDPTLTQSGFLTGTPSYFSPELARGATPDASCDVWALGATLYAAVEGRPPYQAQQNPVAVLHEIANQQPARPSHADFLEPVLLRMMDRDPQSRWSMDDAAHALRRLARQHAPADTRPSTLGLAAGTGAGAATGAAGAAPETASTGADEPPDEPTPTPSPSRRPSPPPDGRGRRRGVYAVLAVLVLLALVGIGYAVTQGSDSSSADGSSSGSTSSSSRPSRSASPSSGASSSASSSPSDSRSPSASTTASNPPASGGSKERFVRGYYAAAPGGTNDGWSQLGPDEQAQGRASYDSFWRGISSVDVSNVQPVAGEDSVDLTLRYHKTNGQVSTERQRIDLIRSSDGGYLINDDNPAG